MRPFKVYLRPMAHISSSTVRIVSADPQANRVKLSNHRTMGFAAARLAGFDPEDFLARQGASQKPLSRPQGR